MQLSAVMLAAGFWSQWFWPIVQFAVGLTVVIFVHELGHFLVAKAVGIKVERFAIGFGPRLIGLQVGETDYCLRVIPFGGYIKMLGQEDVRPLHGDEQLDPRSYAAKPVWARLCVISAGVVMNAVLAAVLFVIVAMVGKDFPAPVVGAVRKHFPAAEAAITWRTPSPPPGGAGAATQPVVTRGLEPGDRIVRIDGNGLILSMIGNEITRFDRIALLAVMADKDETFRMTVERDVDGNTWVGTTVMTVRMGPSRFGGDKLSFGILGAADTVIKKADKPKYATSEQYDPFLDGDRVLAINGRPVRSYHNIEAIRGDPGGASATVRVLRKGQELDLHVPLRLQLREWVVYLADGTRLDLRDYRIARRKEGAALISFADGSEEPVDEKDVTFAREDLILDLLGMVPRLQVTAVLDDSAAKETELKPGDVIVHYGDGPLPTVRELTDTSDKVAGRGESTTLVVERGGKRLEPMQVSPRMEGKRAYIGICRHLEMDRAVVASVRDGSPAGKAGIEPGCVIEKVNDQQVKTWPEVFDALKALAGQEVTLTFRRSDRPQAEQTTATIGLLDEAAFDANAYEYTMFSALPIGFGPLEVTVRKDGIGEALAWSARETGGFILTTYASLRSFILGTVSKEDFLGPVGMGGFAIQAARTGPIYLVYFMAFISTILAVVNFLPLPVVDGGHAVFLLIEKIRGRPLPVRLMNIIQISGLVLLLLVFAAITFQDIMRFFE